MKRLALSAALLATVVSMPAMAADTVTITTPAPFDRWCIKPLCGEAFAAPPALVVPPLYGDDAITGYAEQQLRAAIAAEIDAWVAKNAAEWNTKPIRDVVRSAIAAVLHKSDELEAAQGLGASLLRAGLTLRLETALASDPGCTGAARRDAIYEGLSVTRALGVLSFPEAKREVLAACKPTALRVADAVDGAVLRAIDPNSELPKIVGAAKNLESHVGRTIEAAKQLTEADPAHASKTFAAIAKAQASATILAYVEVVKAALADKAALETWTEGPSAAFAAEVKNLIAVDVAPFDSAFARTLVSVDLKPFVDRGAIDALSCAECGEALKLINAARKGVDAETLRLLIIEVRTRLGLVPADNSVFKGVLDALAEAVVSGDQIGAAVTSATIDGKKFVRDVLSKYCLDESGSFSWECATVGRFKPEPLVFEANGGVPRLRGDELRIVGDLTLGWKTTAIGLIGRGYISYFDYASVAGATDNTHTGGSIEAWYRSGNDASTVRLELRLAGGIDYYDATFVPSGAPAVSGYFHDEDSLLARGTLLAGLVVQPNARFFLELLVGGGAQYESYGYLASDPKDPNVLSDTTAVTGRGNGRLLLRWSFWPSILSFRARADGSLFRLTRDVFTVAQMNRPPSAGVTSTELTQGETTSRAFLDLDFAKLLGFVPAAWGGVDYVQVSSVAGDTTVTVPAFGIGIVRPAF